jgi:hypothetical protein
VQGAPDAGHGQRHAEPRLDQLPDDLTGPQRDRKSVIARIGGDDQIGQLAQLGVGQLAPRARRRSRQQRLATPRPGLGQPGVDRLGMDAHRGQPGAHLGRRHAPGHLIDRPQPQHLKGVVVQLPAVVLAHGPSSSASNRRSTKQQSA